MIRIVPLKKASQSILKDLVHLVSELRRNKAEHKGSLADLRHIVANKNAVMIVVQDGARVVGMGTLYMVRKVGKHVGYIEDIVVSHEYRGQGLGKKIMRSLITAARKQKLAYLFLTSNSKREAANKLYERLGFEIVETNPYRLKL